MTLTATRERSAASLFGREPISVCRAREQARATLRGWGLGEHADLAELVVSELVTNAICHGSGPVEMRIIYTDGDLRVEVHDHGPGRPVRRHTAICDERGRGLELLDGLIELHGGTWGVIDDHTSVGKTIYAALCLPAGPDGGHTSGRRVTAPGGVRA
jgi:anti-sigma regulatory factor (Ser/Thr protein kinase)